MIFLPWEEYLSTIALNNKINFIVWAQNNWHPSFVIKRISNYEWEDVKALDSALEQCIGRYYSKQITFIFLENPQDTMMLKLKFS